MSNRDIVGAIVLVVLFIALITSLWFTLKPSGPAVGYEDNFFVQQRVRIQNQDKAK